MYNVLGVGQPLLDKIFRVSFETMDALGIKERGGSSLIGEEELEELLQKLYTIIEHDCEANMQENFVRTSDDEEDTVESPTTVCDKDFKPVVIAGGSCSNTIKGVSAFGERCAYVGKIGRDSAGKYYKQSLSKRGVIPLMTETFGRTGQVLCLITPDGQRTMRAFLGASSDMNESDLIPNDFHGVNLVHMEGYSIYNQPLLMQALKLAKDNQAMVSYDMGSYEVVRGFRTQIIEVLTNYVDIVFCNSEEASVITNGGTPEECVDYLGSLCRVAVVMMGKEGCWVRSGKEKYRCPTKAIQNPVDTTGAGDLFASGFLYAYLQGYSLEQCARLGALSGAEVVQVMGADIPTDRFAKIKQDVNTSKLMTNTGKILEKSTVEYYGTSPSKNILFPQKIKTAV